MDATIELLGAAHSCLGTWIRSFGRRSTRDRGPGPRRKRPVAFTWFTEPFESYCNGLYIWEGTGGTRYVSNPPTLT